MDRESAKLLIGAALLEAFVRESQTPLPDDWQEVLLQIDKKDKSLLLRCSDFFERILRRIK